MASSNGGRGSSGNNNGKRGVTRMRVIHKAKSRGVNIEVRWNARGQPVGKESQRFVSYIGVIVRRMVPISMENWRAPEMKPYKQKVLDEIRKVYIFGNEHEDHVKMEAGRLFRAFKTTLTRLYVKGKNRDAIDKPPDDKYPHIEQEHWDAFVAQRLTPEFQKRSKENRERALNPRHPYRKSRMGLGRLEEIMKEETGEEMISRASVWTAAHVGKDGVIDNEEVQKVADKCKALTLSLPEHERGKDLGRKDVLQLALDHLPNYSGRVRGYGFAVCPRDIFPRQSIPVDEVNEMFGKMSKRMELLERMVLERQTHDGDTRENGDIEKVVERERERQQPKHARESQHKKDVEERQQQRDAGERQKQRDAGERRQPQDLVQRRETSAKDSCNPLALDVIPKGVSSIEMYLSSPCRHLVAHGKLYNMGSDILHNKKLPPGYVKVRIDVAIVTDALLPIPVEEGDVLTVGEAIGTFVPWQLNFVKLVDEHQKIPDKSKNIDKRPQGSAESIASPNKKMKTVKPKMVPFLDSYVRMLMKKGDLIPIYMDKVIFGKAYTENIEIEHIQELVDHDWLSATVIAVYARFLYDKFIKPRGLVNKFAFLSPHISEDDKQGQMISDILMIHEFKNKLIFAPANLGRNHWVLLVINPGAEIIYYMDSLPGGHQDREYVKSKFMNAMCICRAKNSKSKSKSSKIRWIDIKCPMQTNGIDCGYFLMRFMKEIISENQDMIPTNYFEAYKCKTYSKDKLVEVEEDWATFMVEYIRENVAGRFIN